MWRKLQAPDFRDSFWAEIPTNPLRLLALSQTRIPSHQFPVHAFLSIPANYFIPVNCFISVNYFIRVNHFIPVNYFIRVNHFTLIPHSRIHDNQPSEGQGCRLAMRGQPQQGSRIGYLTVREEDAGWRRVSSPTEGVATGRNEASLR